MEKFCEIYNLFPEQVTEKVINELKILTGKPSLESALEVLNAFPEMFMSAVLNIVYED